MNVVFGSIKILTLYITTLLNSTFIFLIYLEYQPSQLINNLDYKSQHQEIVNFLLWGIDEKLANLLSTDQLSHIKDVRSLFQALQLLALVSLIATAAILIKTPPVQKKKLLMRTALTTVIVAVIIIPLFSRFFILFHHVFFPQGNWSFSSDSILIQLYPEKFWITSYLYITALSFLQLCIIMLVNNTKMSRSHL